MWERNFSRFNAFGLSVFALAACSNATVPASVDSRVLRGHVSVGPNLKATRLVSGGCIQLIEKSNVLYASFFSEPCPVEPKEILPDGKLAFEVEVRSTQDSSLLDVLKDDLKLGELRVVAGEPPTWIIRHFCQFSDPTLRVNRLYSTLCSVRFEGDPGENTGRFKELKIASLTELADQTISDREEWVLADRRMSMRFDRVDRNYQTMRRELEEREATFARTEEELTAAQTKLAGLDQSQKSVRRALDIARATAEVEKANRIKSEIMNSIMIYEQQMPDVALLDRQIKHSESAKIQEQEILAQFGDRFGAGSVNGSQQQLQLKKALDLVRQYILTPEQSDRIKELKSISELYRDKIASLRANEYEPAYKRAMDALKVLIDAQGLVSADEVPALQDPPPPSTEPPAQTTEAASDPAAGY